ncbi:MAG TPA: hypothetical protein V6D06_10500, partial [Trichocoleus sp.]
HPDGTYDIDQRTERRILRYFESLELPAIQVAAQGQAYFDYGSWAISPEFGAGEATLNAAANVPIYLSSLTASSTSSTPGRPVSFSANAAWTERIYRGSVQQADAF